MADTVLLVDDEINVLKSLTRSLRNEPYSVLTAASAEEGLAVLSTTCCKIVVSDEKMPGMAGTDFLAVVKERHPDTVRIMLTGHATLDAAMRAVNQGEIYRFFSKPWDDLAVRFAIRSGLEKYDHEVQTKALLAALPDSLLRCHRNGTCLYYHSMTSHPATFTADRLVGRRLAQALPQELAEPFQQRIDEVLATGAMCIFDFSFSLAGPLRHFEARVVCCGADEVMIMVRDTTEQTEQRQALQTLNATLEARVQEEVAKNREKDRVLALQARQAALGEMVGSIAHQWRQPLTAASSLVQNIKAFSDAGVLTAEVVASTVEAAQQQMRFMSETIDDLRTFFRPDTGMEEFNLADIVGQALRIVAPQLAKAGITSRVGIEAGADCRVRGFANQFKQVLINLLNNAWQAIEEGGASSGMGGVSRWIDIDVQREGTLLRTTVSDSGCGVPGGIRDRIFEPYFTTRAGRGGTGIGLYMSKTIVESCMGGRLYLRDADSPTTFVIELPENLT